MNDLALLWLSLSLSGSLAALALILLKPLIRRFSKTWQYYLWLLVILRLLIPFSPDVSMVGGLFQQIHEAAENVPELSMAKDTQPQVTPGPEYPFTDDAPVADSPFSFQKHNLLGTLWLTAAMLITMILLIRKIIGYRRFIRTVKKESKAVIDSQLTDALQTVSDSMGIKKKIPVRTNPLVHAPMLIGFIRPMIILSNETIPLPELMLIFRHELTHDQRMDFIYKWLVEIAVCLHWFNPLIYWVRREISRDCEFSCDEQVVSVLEAPERRTYGEALLDSIVINNAADADVISLSLNQDGKLIKERLDAMMSYHRKSKSLVLTAALLTSVLLCGTVFAGAYTAGAADQLSGGQPVQSVQGGSGPASPDTTAAHSRIRKGGTAP